MVKRRIIHSYKTDKTIKDTKCIYCGSYGESKDHIPPISRADDFPLAERIIVRACIECNSVLGARLLIKIEERAKFLFEKYKVRYRKILGMPDWDEDEIEELQGMLKRKIILAVKRKKNAIRRLANLENLIETLTQESE